MKNLLSIFFSISFIATSFSQEVNCVDKQNQLSSFLKDKDFVHANEIFSEIKTKCVTSSEDFYKLGIEVLQYNVDVASAEKKETTVRELIKFFDLYDKNFPSNKNGNAINKAMLLYQNNLNNQDEIYTNLDAAFQKDKFQFSNPNALYLYFEFFKAKYSDKKNNITFEQLISKYGQVLEVIEKNKNVFTDKAVEFDNAKLAVESIVRDDFTKENLIRYAETSIDSNTNNVAWLSSTAAFLSEKASSLSIFGRIAENLNKLDPSSKSFYYLADYNLKNRNTEKAIDLFEQSATLASEKTEKAKIYYSLATIMAGTNKLKAKKMINLAIENNIQKGDYYVFLSSLYANSINECATTEIEKKAIYKLANQTIQKATVAEPRFKATVDQFSKQISGKFDLTKQELSQVKKAGGSIKINCWINETVQF